MTEQEILNNAVEYFNGDEIAATVWLKKYAKIDSKSGEYLEHSPEDTLKRVAKGFARIENEKAQMFPNYIPLEEKQIFKYFDKFKYIIPQGSPLFGIGNDQQLTTISNCFVLKNPEDSYESILDTEKQLMHISKRRGGCGLDISNLRPNNAPTSNSALTSTGSISFIKRYTNATNEVGQNGRRGALMIMMRCDHPDIYDFLELKLDKQNATSANLSVKITDEFMKAVEDDTDFDLVFNGVSNSVPFEIKKTVKAKELFDKLCYCACECAEPGVLFWDKIKQQSISDCYEGFEVTAVNPCAELALSYDDKYGFEACRLMSINLYSLVKNAFQTNAELDFELLTKVVKDAVKLCDDLIDLDVEKCQRIIDKIIRDGDLNSSEINIWKSVIKKAIYGRRIGLGITGLGDMLAALSLKYGSEESIKMVDKVFDCIQYNSYLSSIELAKQMKPFEIFDFEKEVNNPYLKDLYERHPDVEKLTKEYGRRNITLLTCPPVGTISILTGTSSGIEPLFAYSYIRRTKVHDNQELTPEQEANVFIGVNGVKFIEHTVWHRVIKDNNVEHPEQFYKLAHEIDWKDRVKMQSTIQRYVDSSISSTINLPKGTTPEVISGIYKTAYHMNLKGVTVYVDGSRDGVLVSESEKKEETASNLNSVKRPKELNCEIIRGIVTNKGNKKYYLLCIGLYEEKPYECFLITSDDEIKELKDLSKGDIDTINKNRSAKIVKIKKGEYVLIVNHNDKDITLSLNNYYEKSNTVLENSIAVLTRLVSLTMRHGIPLEFIVQQLERIEFNNEVWAIKKGLTKYIKNGAKVAGNKCPECNADLVYENGCVICKSCGYSRCSA